MNYEAFDQLCARVHFCTACPRMDASQRVLNRSVGPLDASIMFVGEAPGRLGADGSGIPFHGDKAGHNFESLLEFAKLSRRDVFVTNAVLCNPRDEAGNNSTPKRDEVRNCASFLREQIDLLDPRIVVSLGAVALEALNQVKPHHLSLASGVRTANAWYGRKLIPLYHPGQRAMLHRSLANQRSDYQFVAEEFRRARRPKRTENGTTRADVAAVAREILSIKSRLSYFALHKLFYLVEYEATKQYGFPLTRAFFVRQKDGPYCTDLHLFKLRRAIPELSVSQDGRSIGLSAAASDLFEDAANRVERLADDNLRGFIAKVVEGNSNLSDAELKTKVYMTSPMRRLLRQEREKLVNLYNAPIDFAVPMKEHRYAAG